MNGMDVSMLFIISGAEMAYKCTMYTLTVFLNMCYTQFMFGGFEQFLTRYSVYHGI